MVGRAADGLSTSDEWPRAGHKVPLPEFRVVPVRLHDRGLRWRFSL